MHRCWRFHLHFLTLLEPPASAQESYPFNHLACYRRQQGHGTLQLFFNVHVVCGIISGRPLIFQPRGSLLSVHLAQCVSTAGVNKDLCCQKEADCRSRSAREKVYRGGLDWCHAWLLCVHHAANLATTDLSPSMATQKKPPFIPTFFFFFVPLSYISPSSRLEAMWLRSRTRGAYRRENRCHMPHTFRCVCVFVCVPHFDR